MTPVEIILKDFLNHFQPYFSAPSFLFFKMIVLSFLSRLYVDASLVQVWRWKSMDKHWTNLHRFVKCYKWHTPLLANALLRWLIRRFGIQELYFVADSTDVERYSKKLPAVCRLWNTKLRRYAMSQKWMVIGLLIPSSPDLSQFICCGLLPLLWDKSKKITELLMDGLCLLDLPASMKKYLVVDSGLSSVIPEGWHIITRLRKNVAVFNPPPARTKGKRGRPRKKGKKRHILRTFSRAKDAQILRYRRQDVRVVARRWLVRQWGYKPSLILICQLVNRPDWKPIVLGTTDTEMNPQKLLDLYAARLNIETLFQYVKTKSGFGKYRGKTHEAHERVAQLVLVSHTLKEVMLSTPDMPKIDQNEPWYKGRKDGRKTTGQLRRLMEAWFYAGIFEQFLSEEGKMDKIHHVKERFSKKMARIL
ncbi:MAG: transposase [Acidobacteriota bacterium]|nr:transposase [Acidobacteriota bacterium]